MMKLFAYVGLSLIFTGCASVSFAPSKVGYQPTVVASPDQVEVYRSDKPKGSYVEIGAINFPGGRNLEGLLKKMKAEASKQGGNAIIDLQVTADGAVGTVIKIDK